MMFEQESYVWNQYVCSLEYLFFVYLHVDVGSLWMDWLLKSAGKLTSVKKVITWDINCFRILTVTKLK